MLAWLTSLSPVLPSLIFRAELLDKVAKQMDEGVEARDYSWLVAALDQLKVGEMASTLCQSYGRTEGDVYTWLLREVNPRGNGFRWVKVKMRRVTPFS